MPYPKIHITDFRAIKGELSISLEKSFNVFIGEQATGKSTLAKCVFFFHSVMEVFIDYLPLLADKKQVSGDSTFKDWKEKLTECFYDTFDGSLNPRSKIEFEYAEGYSCAIKLRKENQTDLSFSEKMTQMFFDALEYYKAQNNGNNFVFSYAAALNTRAKMANEHPAFFANALRPVYIPAGRVNYNAVNSVPTTSEAKHFDYPEQKFLLNLSYAKRYFLSRGNRFPAGTRRRYNSFLKAKKIFESILKGTYVQKNDGDFVESPDGSSTPFALASSGQQEILSLGLLLILELMLSSPGLIIIEEPEAHLFPDSQKKLMDLIALVSNVSKCKIIITTHSPYVLMCAHIQVLSSVKESNEAKAEGNSVVDPDFRIASNQLSAYMFSFEGDSFSYCPIEKSGLVDASFLDSISDSFEKMIVSLIRKGQS